MVTLKNKVRFFMGMLIRRFGGIEWKMELKGYLAKNYLRDIC